MRAMERAEGSAWSLAGGALCVFVLAILLKDLAVPVVLAVLAAATGLWSLSARVWAGAALGLIAWALLTGFAVSGNGDLTFPGSAGWVRLAVLVAAGAIGSLAGRLLERRDERRAAVASARVPGAREGEWVHRVSSVSDGRYPVSRVRASGDPTKEPRDV